MATGFALLVFTCFVIGLFYTELNAQELVSPCPKVFVYEARGKEPDRWYGIVFLRSNAELSGIWLRLILDRPSLELGNWFGEVKTEDKIEYLIKNKKFKLSANVVTPLRFYIQYDPSQPIPRLVSVRLNAKQVCPEDPAIPTSSPVSTEVFTSKELEITSVLPPRPKEIVTKDIGNTENSVHSCGRPSTTRATPLILHGENTTKGEWPWHLAIYKNVKGTLKYTCGGSLISNSYMITAAHCVADLYTGQPLQPNNFLVYIGTTSLKDFPPGIQISQIRRIWVHPDYSSDNFHNDIAILKATRPIEYTEYVKPVCLWEGDNNLNSVVGVLATVVGWGIDENKRPSEILKRLDLPIVDTVNCIYSNPDFFSKFTSLTTFCAGFRNGSNVCNGDSGSGMVISKPNSDGKSSWYLRGLVSTSVPMKGTSICDPDYYVVFTDVAKFGSWIQGILTNYI